MCASSVWSERRNFLRAGTLKNRSRTVMVVPGGPGRSSQRSSFPPAISTDAPVVSSRRAGFEQQPRDARRWTAALRRESRAWRWTSRSLTSLSLLVAWRSKASSASSRSMPQPLSATRIRRRPPALDVDAKLGGAGVEGVFEQFLDD